MQLANRNQKDFSVVTSNITNEVSETKRIIRRYDWWLYKERHLVETFFNKLKEFRRVTMRYDKLASRFLSFVHLACIRILLA